MARSGWAPGRPRLLGTTATQAGLAIPAYRQTHGP